MLQRGSEIEVIFFIKNINLEFQSFTIYRNFSKIIVKIVNIKQLYSIFLIISLYLE